MTERDDGTVGKALEVLDLVAAQGRPVRFVDLQRISPLPKATLYRLVKTLVNQSMLVQLPEGGLYALGPRVVRLAQAAVRHVTLSDIARPHLDVLASQTGESRVEAPVHQVAQAGTRRRSLRQGFLPGAQLHQLVRGGLVPAEALKEAANPPGPCRGEKVLYVHPQDDRLAHVLAGVRDDRLAPLKSLDGRVGAQAGEEALQYPPLHFL